jgi:transposase InsO family protein
MRLDAPNFLERDFDVEEPNRVLAGDITYAAASDGWLYLAVLLDLYSRRVVGWANVGLHRHWAGSLSTACRGVYESPRADWIHHTDRDCRHRSDEYLVALKQLGARPSMSRKGDCWDNSVSESFFATLENELLAPQPLQDRSKTRKQVADYIDNYYTPSSGSIHIWTTWRRSSSRPTHRINKHSNLSATPGRDAETQRWSCASKPTNWMLTVFIELS